MHVPPPAHVGSPVPGGPTVPLTVAPELLRSVAEPRWVAIDVVHPGRLPSSPLVLVYLVPDAGVTLDSASALLGSWSDVGKGETPPTITVSGIPSAAAVRALRASAHPRVRVVVLSGSARIPLTANEARIVDLR